VDIRVSGKHAFSVFRPEVSGFDCGQIMWKELRGQHGSNGSLSAFKTLGNYVQDYTGSHHRRTTS
jgi:hypothetical protein